MTKLAVNDYLSSLQQQVAVSVSKLNDKSSASHLNDSVSEEALYGYATGRLNPKAYSLLSGEISYRLLSFGGDKTDSSYAAQSYEAAAQVNRPTSVLLDFMFKNNREFDFKV